MTRTRKIKKKSTKKVWRKEGAKRTARPRKNKSRDPDRKYREEQKIMQGRVISEVFVGKRNATITRRAFIGMITNAVEVYKKETFGILLGKKHKKHYYVTDTIAYQSAKRSYDWVDVTTRKINKINFALSHLTDEEVIGDFHSHPQGPDKLSATDVGDLLKGSPTLTCLISVYRRKGCKKWKRCDDKSICGSLGNQYFVKIMAYEINHKKNELVRLKIVCPYIKTINKLSLYKEPYC